MTQEEGLRRVLGLVSATCIVIGAIVGVGIFFTPSAVAAVTGSQGLALAAWGLGGVVALLGALTFAELGGMYRESGAQYRVLQDAYGSVAGYLYVFCNLTAIQSGAAAIIALVCADNLGVAVSGQSPSDGLRILLSLALIGGLVCANVLGVRFGSAIQTVNVFVKVAVLLVVAGIALVHGADADAAAVQDVPEPAGGVTGLFAGLVPVLFAFGGWQHGLWIGGEVREPQKNVPRAIVLGILVVIGVYLLANWAFFALLGHGAVATSHALAADAVSGVWPESGARIVAAAVAFSAFGVLNAQFLSGPRLAFAMARDGRFFAVFGRVSRFATPLCAILTLGLLAVLLILLAGQDGIDQLTNGVVLVDSFFFVLTGAALIALRRRRPDLERSVRVPLYPVVPLLFVAGELCVLAGAFLVEDYRATAVIGVAWIGVAALTYALFFRRPRS